MGHRSQSGRVLLQGPSEFETTGYGCLRVMEYQCSEIRCVCWKIVMTACKSLEQDLGQAGLHTVMDKRLAIDLSALRQLVWRLRGEDVGDSMVSDKPLETATTTVNWVDKGSMFADGQTKCMRSPHEMMSSGIVKVSFQKVEKDSRPKKDLRV